MASGKNIFVDDNVQAKTWVGIVHLYRSLICDSREDQIPKFIMVNQNKSDLSGKHV